MAESIEFTRNYSDHSTQHGFQFEFFCDRCGNGHRTRFKPYSMGVVDNALDTASSLLGGIFGQASTVSNRLTEAQRERAREDAFLEAVAELKPLFVQCPRCMSWVCRKNCWSEKRGICKNCAPDLAAEMSAAQAEAAIQKARETAQASAEDQKQLATDWSDTVQAQCPECGEPLKANAKFCSSCGAKLKTATFCPECGAKLDGKAKFCTECGHKVG